jgi:putative Mg2+ transporter-C (MgtC) family protein
MNVPDTAVEILVRLSLAVAFAALLGWERESANKPAGLRTYMMVALGSAAFTIAALTLSAQVSQPPGRNADPLRMLDGIIGGIGFLGAGSIIQSRGAVTGVTTAAGIWVMAAIGVACGCGYFELAGIVTTFAFIILWLLGWIERLIGVNNSPNVVPAKDPESAA